jgi:hypothetical protein
MRRLLIVKRPSWLLCVPLDMGGKGRPHQRDQQPSKPSLARPGLTGGGDRLDECTPRPSEDDQAKPSKDWKLET